MAFQRLLRLAQVGAALFDLLGAVPFLEHAELGVRPEFVRFAEAGIPVRVERACDIGRFRIVDVRHGEHLIKLLVAEGQAMPEGAGHLAFDVERTRVYVDGWALA